MLTGDRSIYYIFHVTRFDHFYFLRNMSTICPFITTTLLACISEILPVIRNDILKILSDFIQFCQRLMSQIFSKACSDLETIFWLVELECQEVWSPRPTVP